MAARSNSSTTSLMNSARSPSGSHCRMAGGSSNCWSSVYGRNAFVMANTLATAPPRGHSLFSDTLLVAQLPDPINDAVTLGYLSGWRRAEVLRLTWLEVDRTRGLITPPADRSENREPRELPLSPALAALIEKRCQARHVSGPTGRRASGR